jgi:hypothetical protein
VAGVLFIYIAVHVFDNVDQDAWIYFTYFKEFFHRPFSFQPGHVTFGATSPLHVVVFAPIHALFGARWLTVAKVVNLSFVFLGVCVVHRASGLRVEWLPVSVAFAATYHSLFQSTATLFDTGLSFCAVAVLIAALRSNRTSLAIAIAGSLNLVRPELALDTVAVVVFLRTVHGRWFLRDWAVAFLPSLFYYGYMWMSGAGMVPTSVVGRALLVRELHAGWADRIAAVLDITEIRWYAVAMLAVPISLATARLRALPGLITALPVIVLYAASPPGYAYYAPRYLVPAIPGLIYCAALTVEPLCSRARRRALPGLTTLAVAGALATVLALQFAPRRPAFDAYAPDMILQRDLGVAVRDLMRPDDRVLMYEIQGQYYLPAFAISADGIVGTEAHDFLTGRESFDDFVDREQIRWVVTFNGFDYRPIYAGTPLVALYAHDLRARVGDRVCLGRWCYRKMVENPFFGSDYVEIPVAGLNEGTALRYYSGHQDERLRGQLIQWNSVYQVTPAPGRPGESSEKVL